jgi:hypothetical protein
MSLGVNHLGTEPLEGDPGEASMYGMTCRRYRLNYIRAQDLALGWAEIGSSSDLKVLP